MYQKILNYKKSFFSDGSRTLLHTEKYEDTSCLIYQFNQLKAPFKTNALLALLFSILGLKLTVLLVTRFCAISNTIVLQACGVSAQST